MVRALSVVPIPAVRSFPIKNRDPLPSGLLKKLFEFLKTYKLSNLVPQCLSTLVTKK